MTLWKGGSSSVNLERKHNPRTKRLVCTIHWTQVQAASTHTLSVYNPCPRRLCTPWMPCVNTSWVLVILKKKQKASAGVSSQYGHREIWGTRMMQPFPAGIFKAVYNYHLKYQIVFVKKPKFQITTNNTGAPVIWGTGSQSLSWPRFGSLRPEDWIHGMPIQAGWVWRGRRGKTKCLQRGRGAPVLEHPPPLGMDSHEFVGSSQPFCFAADLVKLIQSLESALWF